MIKNNKWTIYIKFKQADKKVDKKVDKEVDKQEDKKADKNADKEAVQVQAAQAVKGIKPSKSYLKALENYKKRKKWQKL